VNKLPDVFIIGVIENGEEVYYQDESRDGIPSHCWVPSVHQATHFTHTDQVKKVLKEIKNRKGVNTIVLATEIGIVTIDSPYANTINALGKLNEDDLKALNL